MAYHKNSSGTVLGSPETASLAKSAREAKGLSKAEVARASGLSWRTIARVENGGDAATETMLALERTLGIEGRLVPEGHVRPRGIGHVLRELRRASKNDWISGKEGRRVTLADMLGDEWLGGTVARLSRLERGLHSPPGGWAIAIFARAFDMSERELEVYLKREVEDGIIGPRGSNY